MHPIEEFVSYFTFLHELGQYFLEVKEKEIRHAMTCLFVEILLPVAAVVRHEVNIPALKNFVDLLYNPALELANKKKHALVGDAGFLRKFLCDWYPIFVIYIASLTYKTFQFAHLKPHATNMWNLKESNWVEKKLGIHY